MSDSEKEILKRIKDNPFISQRELAEAIGLSVSYTHLTLPTK